MKTRTLSIFAILATVFLPVASALPNEITASQSLTNESGIAAPTLTLATSGIKVSLSWSSVTGATGYTLYYAPYPYTGSDSIENISMGMQTSMSVSLWEGAAFYVAVQSYNSKGQSGYSNITHFELNEDPNYSPYFIIPQNGDKIKEQSYITFTNSGDYLSSDVTYIWYSGTKMVSGVETLREFSSLEGFDAHNYAISYMSASENELRVYKMDTFVNNLISGVYLFDPYIATPLNMEPGQSYYYSSSWIDTYNNVHLDYTSNFSNIQRCSIRTHFGVFPDCLKVTVRTTCSNITSTAIRWLAKDTGLVRIINNTGDNSSTTVDIKRTYY